MEVILHKLPNGALAPVDEDQAALLRRIKQGAGVRCEIVQIRNYPFLKKFMVLVGLAFDMWSETMPATEWRGVAVRSNKERFRNDLTIMAGHFDAEYAINGEVRLKAKSISFANMAEEEFEKLYSSVIDTILSKVLSRPDLTPEKMRAWVDEVMRFS